MKQTSFTRTLYNDLKLGAYYTDKGHAARLGQMFQLKGETCILEPSVGDASALYAFASNVSGKEKLKLFGVELNSETFENVKDKLHFCLNEDFLKGVRISSKAFSLCFSNPPYGTMENGDRYETEFVKKIYLYMSVGGYLVLIVSRACLEDADFTREFAARFKVENVFKFDENEYKKYHQYAIIATRLKSVGVLKQELDSFREGIRKDQYALIPEQGAFDGKPYEVPESKESDIVLFTTVHFDYQKAAESLDHSSLYAKLQSAMVHTYSTMKVGDPVLPLKKDLLYLSSIAGAGEGLAGTERERDLHLQRGTVNVETTSDFQQTEDGRMIEVVTSRSVVAINIIDNEGHIITLK